MALLCSSIFREGEIASEFFLLLGPAVPTAQARRFSLAKNAAKNAQSSSASPTFVSEGGAVELSRHGVTLARLGPGATFGEDALCPGSARRRRERTAVAVNDSELALLNKQVVVQLASEYPELAANLADVSDKRAAQHLQRVLALSRENGMSFAQAARFVVLIQRFYRGWRVRKVIREMKQPAADDADDVDDSRGAHGAHVDFARDQHPACNMDVAQPAAGPAAPTTQQLSAQIAGLAATLDVIQSQLLSGRHGAPQLDGQNSPTTPNFGRHSDTERRISRLCAEVMKKGE